MHLMSDRPDTRVDPEDVKRVDSDDVKPDDSELASKAYELLRRHILDGHIEPGAVISQARLAPQLGVSRTPLREAIRRLQMEGLVNSEFNRRVTVATVETSAYEQLYAMRIALEPLAVRITVPLLTGPELDRIGESLNELDRLSESRDFMGARSAHRAFHSGLFQHAGEDIVTRVADLWDHAERFRLYYNRNVAPVTGTHQLASVEHHEILDAARAGDADGASRLVADHLGRVVLTTLAGLDGRYDPRAVRAALDLTRGGELTGRGSR